MEVPQHTLEDLRRVVARVWGFERFRPLQETAMQRLLERRDTLVVLPTGGGKSLCYQAPAVLSGRTTIVVSPLIALMKDQVDALNGLGVPATALNSSLGIAEQNELIRRTLAGEFSLVYVSPERLATPGFQNVLKQIDPWSFAIDEAHCISHWGHDFRPEYRQLRTLKERFPQTPIQALTATATQQVRGDILAELNLASAEVLVGNFDRPNLVYRVTPRSKSLNQVQSCLARHAGEAGIIYCIRRRDVDDLAAALQAAGTKVVPYHAGINPRERQEAQEAFVRGKCDVIVATVAFGMGIDRSDVRFVLHTGMPKSLEHYQQEAGRAGRDGLEAECLLLYSPADALTWRSLIDRAAAESTVEVDPEYLLTAYRHLAEMENYARAGLCRHRAILKYFGQTLAGESCQACDICLGERGLVSDSHVIVQKILSCVARVHESFGIGQISAILRGERTDAVTRRQHDQLSTFGLLSTHGKSELRDWIGQLVGQGVLQQTPGEYPILKLTEFAWEVMRGQRQGRLTETVVVEEQPRAVPERAKSSASWAGVDRELFEALRAWRKATAAERSVAAYIILGDAVLRELARHRPTTAEGLKRIHGIGERKLRDYGEELLKLITGFGKSQ